MSQSSCDGFHSERLEQRVPLSTNDAGQSDAGTLATEEECRTFCERNGGGFGSQYACRTEGGDGGLVVVCSFNTMCEGRRPEGFCPPHSDVEAPLCGRYFAAMAATEAASVIAFERIASELDAHGAPAKLVSATRGAALEESRHFRMAAGLARRFGVKARRGDVAPRRDRSLHQLGLENAREGVVRETLGAAFGEWQAHRAAEPAVRQVMRRIARDEASHAALSFAIDEWVRRRSTAEERAELDAERATALESFGREIEVPVPDELVARAGLPAPRVARAPFDVASARLFS